MIDISNEKALKFEDVSLIPQPSTVNSRSLVNLTCTYTTKYSKRKIECIPVMAANLFCTGVFSVAKVLSKYKMYTFLHKLHTNELLEYYDNDPETFKYCVPTYGITDNDLENLEWLCEYIEPEIICFDIANGYINKFHDTLKQIRMKLPCTTIIAGNVVTPEGIELLDTAEVDIIKLGVASGGVCSTKDVTGIYYPQFQALVDCMEEKNSREVLLISDGGCKVIADFAKALAVGSEFVMSGSFFAGHDENVHDAYVSKKVEGVERKFCEVFGSSSRKAMEKANNYKDYRASEGLIGYVPYKGSIENTVKEILGGLRSTCTYLNCSELSNISKNARFLRI